MQTARNFNADMVTAARCTIVEVEEIVEAGQLQPEDIHTAGVFVDHIFIGDRFEKRFEKVIYDPAYAPIKQGSKNKDTSLRDKIIKRAALEV